jgi:hypothetical protein
VFKPNLPQSWMGELQLNYGSGQSITMYLKGTAQLKNNLTASNIMWRLSNTSRADKESIMMRSHSTFMRVR